jgi:hypothetical protein
MKSETILYPPDMSSLSVEEINSGIERDGRRP